jgi:hypothetical protein
MMSKDEDRATASRPDAPKDPRLIRRWTRWLRARPRHTVRRDIPFDQQIRTDARPGYQDPRPGLNSSGFQIGGH